MGSSFKLGFAWLYELSTGKCPVRFLPDGPDCSETLAQLLTQIAYLKETKNGDKVNVGPAYLPYAVMAVLAAGSPAFPVLLPYDGLEKAMSGGYATFTETQNSNPVRRFLDQLVQFCVQRTQTNEDFMMHSALHQTMAVQQKPEIAIPLQPLSWPRAVLSNNACSLRSLTRAPEGYGNLLAAATEPLAALVSPVDAVEGKKINVGLPFDGDALSKRHGQHPVATATVKRLSADMKHFADQVNNERAHELRYLSRADAFAIASPDNGPADKAVCAAAVAGVGELVGQLTALKETVQARAAQLQAEVLASANVLYAPHTNDAGRTTAQIALDRISRTRASVRLSFLVASLLSSRATEDLVSANPCLQDGQDSSGVTALLERVAWYLLTVNQLGHVLRCLTLASELHRTLQAHAARAGDGGKDDAQSLCLQTEALCKLLTVKRQYFKSVDGELKYDPRYLVFEFLFDVVLRGKQVQLVEDFASAARAGNSRVHQMIMGAGKTTVVGPLLCLMLADRQSLLTQVVPRYDSS